MRDSLETIGYNTEIRGTIERRSDKSLITIGNDCLIEGYLVTEKDDSRIAIGNNVYIGGQTVIDCATSIEIGDDVLVSYRCLIIDADGHSIKYSIRKYELNRYREKKYDWSSIVTSPVRILKGAWIGAHSIILKGVTIGEGAIVGAGSVVTRNVPSWTVVAGNPARQIRKLEEDER